MLGVEQVVEQSGFARAQKAADNGYWNGISQAVNFLSQDYIRFALQQLDFKGYTDVYYATLYYTNFCRSGFPSHRKLPIGLSLKFNMWTH